jgi:hypothetical protein
MRRQTRLSPSTGMPIEDKVAWDGACGWHSVGGAHVGRCGRSRSGDDKSRRRDWPHAWHGMWHGALAILCWASGQFKLLVGRTV